MRKVLGLVLAMVLVTPGAGAAMPPESRRADPPLWPTVVDAPPGARVELCPWLVRDGTTRTASLVLPASIESLLADDGRCYFGRDEDDLIGLTVTVTLAQSESLLSYKRRDIDPWVGDGGDENISDVVYADDVAVFGDRVGERLSYDFANDGLPMHVEHQQTEGVLLTWSTSVEDWPAEAGELDRAARSLGIDAVRLAECGRRSPGARSSVRVEVPDGVRLLDSERRCSFSYTEDRFSRTSIADLVAAPARGFAATYKTLTGRDDVRRLRRTASAPGFDDDPARRLDYRVRTSGRGPDRRVRILQQDGVRLVWTSPLTRWPSQRADYTRLRRAVTVVPLP